MKLQNTPSSHGFHMPAEWERHSQCWMGWPVSIHFIHTLFFFPLSFSLSLLLLRDRNAPIIGVTVLFMLNVFLLEWRLRSQNSRE
jgi:hypothetical protein